MKRAVITGAAGMIGVHLTLELLAQGWEVLAIVRPGSPHNARLGSHPGLRLCERGLSELSSVSETVSDRYDVFFHLGWSGASSALRADPAVQQPNIGYTLDAVRLAERLGCTRFIGAGSQAEYGPKYDMPISPETPAAPANAYGVAKLAAGGLALLDCARRGIDCIWVRIFSVYGRYDLPTTMISNTLAALRRGETPSFTPGTHLWDYLEARDAARALRLIAERGVPGIYCLGSGEGKPLREYIELLRNTVAPGASLGIGAIPYAGRPANLQADLAALTRDTGFLPRIGFAEGIRRLWEEEFAAQILL